MNDQTKAALILGFLVTVLDTISAITDMFNATSVSAIFGAVVGIVARLLTVLLVVRSMR